MSNESVSIIAQKVRSAMINADGFPELTRLSTVVAKTTAAAAGEMLNVPAQGMVAFKKIYQLKEALDDAPDFGSFSWIKHGQGQKALLVILDNRLVALLTERMLGGGIVKPPEDATLSKIDAALSYKFVDGLIGPLNRAIQKLTGPRPDLILGKRTSINTPEDALGELEMLTIFEVAVDLMIEESTMMGAMRLCFPVDYVEQGDFLKERAAALKTNDSSPWRLKLAANVKQLELDISIVLSKMYCSVGELSRLSPGQIIDVDEEALNSLELVVKTNEGRNTIASGQLGAVKSQKAVKLTTDIDDTFLPHF